MGRGRVSSRTGGALVVKDAAGGAPVDALVANGTPTWLEQQAEKPDVPDGVSKDARRSIEAHHEHLLIVKEAAMGPGKGLGEASKLREDVARATSQYEGARAAGVRKAITNAQHEAVLGDATYVSRSKHYDALEGKRIAAQAAHFSHAGKTERSEVKMRDASMKAFRADAERHKAYVHAALRISAQK